MHKIVEAAFTRPADTTQYAINDVISDSTSSPTVMEFAECGRRKYLGGYIRSAIVVTSTHQATAGQYRLFVFDTEPTAMEDNAAFDPTDAELANVVAVFSFTTEIDGTAGTGGNLIYLNGTPQRHMPYKTGASRSLYGILVALNTYTPPASEVFTVRLGIFYD